MLAPHLHRTAAAAAAALDVVAVAVEVVAADEKDG